jgi:NAD(P)-dependent dehydrogenase (short-subunit alcohol dehydrogenase family)
VFATAFDDSGPPLSSASADGDLRRAVVGIAMGMNAIAPGKEQEREHIPQKGRGSPDEVAGWIVRFADPASEWVTGQVIAVDGGLGVT